MTDGGSVRRAGFDRGTVQLHDWSASDKMGTCQESRGVSPTVACLISYANLKKPFLPVGRCDKGNPVFTPIGSVVLPASRFAGASRHPCQAFDLFDRKQPFNSGVPARAWKTIVCALASGMPSIGILQVYPAPAGMLRAEAAVECRRCEIIRRPVSRWGAQTRSGELRSRSRHRIEDETLLTGRAGSPDSPAPSHAIAA
jgi:hypothetical protein